MAEKKGERSGRLCGRNCKQNEKTANKEWKYLIILNFWTMLWRVKTPTFSTLLGTTGCHHTYAYGKLTLCTNTTQRSCLVYNYNALTIWLLGAFSFHSVSPVANVTPRQSRLCSPFVISLKTAGLLSQSRYLPLCIVLFYYFSLEENSAFERLC